MVVFASGSHAAYLECKIAEQAISVGSEAKCLGYWWQGDLMVNRAVEEDIKKARRSLLFSRAVVESCVMPVLLYGCANQQSS